MNVKKYKQLGDELSKESRWQEAATAYRKAIEIKPKWSNLYYLLAQILEKQRDLEEATANYQRAVELNSTVFRHHKSLGDILAKQKRFPEAIDTYQQAIKLQPDNANIYYLLGIVQEQIEDLESAIEQYKKAIKIDPEILKFYESLGNVLTHRSRFAEAISTYQQAVKLNPNNANIYCLLAQALENKGDLQGAIQNYQQALSLDPEISLGQCQSNIYEEQKIPCTITLNVGSGLGDCLIYIKSMVMLADILNFRVENIFGLQKNNRRISSNNNLFKQLGVNKLEQVNFLYQFNNYQKIDIDFGGEFEHKFNTIKTKIYILTKIIEKAKDKNFYINFNSCSIHFCVSIFIKYKEKVGDVNLHKRNIFLSSLKELIQNQLEIYASPMDSNSPSKIKILLHIRLGDTAIIRLSNNSLISCHGKKGKQVDGKNPPEKINSIEEAARPPVNVSDFVAIYNFLSSQFRREHFYITVISDGYDRGFDDIYNSKHKLKLNQHEVNQISILRQKYKQEFFQTMSFADQIIYGENDQNLINSIYRIINSDIIISRSGHYVYQILDSCGYDKNYIFVKSSGRPTEANINENFREKTWGEHENIESINKWLKHQITNTLEDYLADKKYNKNNQMINPKPDTNTNCKKQKKLGDEFSSQERWEEAAMAYQEAIQIKPKWSNLYYLLAIALEKKGDLEGAIVNYQQAVFLSRRISEYKEALHKAMGKQKSWQQEIKACENLLQQDIPSEAALRLCGSQAHFGWGGLITGNPLADYVSFRRSNPSWVSGEKRIVLLTSVRNEGVWLPEWIAYHLSLGFNKILVYANDCTDKSDHLLRELDRFNYIKYIENHLKPEDRPQIKAYFNALNIDKVCVDYEWVMVLDADEFLVLNRDKSIQEFVKRFDDNVDGIAMNWRVFGSNGRQSKTEGLVIERFQACVSPDHPANGHVKSLARTNSILSFGVHVPVFRPGCNLFVYPDGKPVTPINGLGKYIDYSISSIHHYGLKSYEEFLIKSERGVGDRPLSPDQQIIRGTDFFIGNDRDSNKEKNSDALKWLDATKRILDGILSVPDIANAYQAVLDWYDERVKFLRSRQN
jgi:tetratricopeptide (TPR) repeat protein